MKTVSWAFGKKARTKRHEITGPFATLFALQAHPIPLRPATCLTRQGGVNPFNLIKAGFADPFILPIGLPITMEAKRRIKKLGEGARKSLE